MKYLIISLFLCFYCLEAVAQINFSDPNPKHKTDPEGGIITRIDYKENKIVVFFEINNQTHYHVTLYGPDHANAWELYDVNSDKSFSLLLIKNVWVDGELATGFVLGNTRKEFDHIKRLRCEAHFERPDKQIQEVDMIEKNIRQIRSKTQFQSPFNIYGIILKRKPTETSKPPVVAEKKQETSAPPKPKETPAIIAKEEPLQDSLQKVITEKPTDFIGQSIEEGKTYRLANVLFRQSEYKILTDAATDLDKVANLMLQNPSMEIELSGHTDNMGEPAMNLELSKLRVIEAKTYLVQKRKIDSRRVSIKYYGNTQPVAPNDSDINRALNRRVEMKIVKT